MKNIFNALLALVFILNSSIGYGDAAIFSGSNVKILKDNLDFNGKSKILNSTTDPSTVATSGAIGDLLMNRTTGKLYRKLDAGSTTNWVRVEQTLGGAYNLLTDPSFEQSLGGWTASGLTSSRTTTNGQVGSEPQGFYIDASSASQTLVSNSVTVTSGNGYASQPFTASCRFKSDSGIATYKIQLYDGSGVLAEETIRSDTSAFYRTSATGTAPTSGTVSLRIISVASNEPRVYMDDCYLGLAEGLNVSQVSQSRILGVLTISTCTGSRNSSTVGALTISGTCAYSAVGGVTQPAANDMAVRILNAPAGDYFFDVRGQFGKDVTTTNSTVTFALHNGTSTGTQSSFQISSTSGQSFASNGFTATFASSAASSDITYQIQCATSTTTSSTNCTVASGLEITVFYYPSASQVVARVDQVIDPIGTIITTTSSTCPTGTLAADGAAISRTTYAKLYQRIGVTHGQGDNSTTFNKPDYRGRFLRGVDGAAGNDPDRASRTAMATGGNTGDNVGSIQGHAFQTHNHAFSINGYNATSNNNIAAGATVLQNTVNFTTSNASASGGTSQASSNESRPVNANVKYCIVYDGQINMPLVLTNNQRVQSITASTYTILCSDDHIFVDTTSNTVTLTLPGASVCGIGKELSITKTNSGTNQVVVTRAGSDNIGSALTSTYVIGQDETIILEGDGSSKWRWKSDPYREVSAYLNCDASSATTSEEGDWISGNPGNISGGACTVTFVSNVFSAQPRCFLGGKNTDSDPPAIGINITSATAASLDCANGITDCTEYDVNILCRGAR